MDLTDQHPLIAPLDEPLVIAGPCMAESLDLLFVTADRIAAIADRLKFRPVFKSSFDKANRTSGGSQRGPGLEAGLAMLRQVSERTGMAIITDVHESWQVPIAAEVADILQIPAFLSRQTDLLRAAGASGRPVMIKKGQFMAPEDVVRAADKVADALPAGMDRQRAVMLCERGTSFGYRDLVVDMRGLGVMRASGHPVIFDASHSVQQPAALDGRSGGVRSALPALARAAAAAGIDGLFIETHPDPDQAWSDAATQWPLDRLEQLLAEVLAIHRLVRDSSGAMPAAVPIG
ncbi:3-deoxy-8-phosphooctulonate synthase [Sphingomonas sp. CJ99]